MNWSVVGVGVKDLIRIAVPAMVGSFLPELRAIQVWLRNPKEREGSDLNRQLEDEEADERSWGPPLPWDGGEAVFKAHGTFSSSLPMATASDRR